MSRRKFKLRKNWNECGHAHELTFCCYHRYKFLASARTCEWFVSALELARVTHGFSLWAYVLMPEHAHLLLWPRPGSRMEDIRKSIKQVVARQALDYLRRTAPHWLPRLRVAQPGGRVRHHFWQPGGGYDRNLWREASVWSSIEYIHMNPVRRELCRQPEDWKWSSARWYAGLDDVAIRIDNPPAGPTTTQRTRWQRD